MLEFLDSAKFTLRTSVDLCVVDDAVTNEIKMAAYITTVYDWHKT